MTGQNVNYELGQSLGWFDCDLTQIKQHDYLFWFIIFCHSRQILPFSLRFSVDLVNWFWFRFWFHWNIFLQFIFTAPHHKIDLILKNKNKNHFALHFRFFFGFCFLFKLPKHRIQNFEFRNSKNCNWNEEKKWIFPIFEPLHEKHKNWISW